MSPVVTRQVQNDAFDALLLKLSVMPSAENDTVWLSVRDEKKMKQL